MMIARSDIIILVLASTALAGGIYRWQHNVQTVSSVTIPANTRMRVATQPATPPVSLEPEAIGSIDAPLANSRLNTEGADATASVQTKVVAEPVPVEVAPAKIVPADEYGTYKVVSGDYLERIAKRYDTTVNTLQELNDLTGTTIQIGQKLRYPLIAN